MLGLDAGELKESFTFGVNEIVMTMLCALSGIMHKKKRDILYFIFVTGFASIIPDIYAYYLMQRQKNISISEAIVTTLPLVLAEIVSITLISMPLIFLNNKYTRFFSAIAIGTILVIISTYLNEEKETTLTNFIEPIFIILLGVGLTYFLTSAGDKYLMPIVDRHI
jgi:hypothetical protein